MAHHWEYHALTSGSLRISEGYKITSTEKLCIENIAFIFKTYIRLRRQLIQKSKVIFSLVFFLVASNVSHIGLCVYQMIFYFIRRNFVLKYV